ncbi:MAG: beta-lactamase family protein [Lentisphaeraceae bacterium]|nr:beta-lactamase family protein [Lentisphaeraceae bacterium]
MKNLLLCVCLFLFASCSSTSLPEATPESVGVSSDALINLVDKLDKEVDGMHGIVIMRHGKVISKGWWAPYQQDNTHILYSLSKSFCSTAIGMAVDEGILSLDDKVVKFFPDDLPANPSENLKAMTIKDLLIMGTGNHNDTLGPIKETKDKNWPKVFLAQPVEHKPGSYFRYNTGATYMCSAILQKVTGKTLVEFLKPRLFDPLGIKEYTWEEDPMGVNTGGYGLKIKTEAIAKFGQLYLQKGMWEGKRLLSEEWIKMATSKQINNGSNPKSDWNQGYGFQFWMCRHNAYRGDGAFGQYCIVMPEQDAVIAIHSGIGNMQQVLNIIWDNFLPELKKEPLSANPESYAKLQKKMSALNLPLVKKHSVPSAGIVGQTFNFEDNEKGFKSITVEDQNV